VAVAENRESATGAAGVRWRNFLVVIWTVVGPFLGLLAIAALFAYLTRGSGQFMSAYNWRTIAVQTVVLATASLGMTVIMIAGGIDLSVGSAVALVTVATAVGVRDMGLPMAGAMVLGIAVGGMTGLLNGSLISGLGVVPFIITLGGLKVFRGLAKWLSGSTQVYVPAADVPDWLGNVLATEPQQSWMIVAPGVWGLLALSLFVALALRYSILGRSIYAIGSNESTARLCGLNVSLVKVAVYTLAGLATGLAGVFQFAYLHATGDPVTGDGLELQVIAAVVIGGGSLSGGEGTVAGTLIGCLIVSVLNNGCVHAGISNASQDVIIGAIIVGAVALDRLRRRSGA
jgi:ribose/xylose/arabinose/galactoside ABC-type transport system permease subunit